MSFCCLVIEKGCNARKKRTSSEKNHPAGCSYQGGSIDFVLTDVKFFQQVFKE